MNNREKSLPIHREKKEKEKQTKKDKKELAEPYIYPAYDHDLEQEYDAIRSIN
ncbi:hypothetical protein [Legionella londiniensis]|uniref:Uncharacterized protein n=1 Tax=Legionella londiniensis TaxID=45068 RepID=A0A0W0VQV4_9GAMM|nr:hypothetical protein [Legionella londiniensis]KTD22497.1 hypothetical protein Llon_0537 [Legionella londiniensis]STX93350.1 Uncharacterised protein [Legionella londiniensis]